MLRPNTAFLTCLLLLPTALLRADEPPAHRTLAGNIEGARWTALIPDNWNERLLIEAPDCLRAAEPLAASIDVTDHATGTLLTAGWAVATTSYRRHGPLVADGIDDLRALRDRLVEEIGLPKLTVVEGSGMGGLIATFIAERHADEFHGSIAHDPQLDLRDPRALRLRCDYQPRAPLLFLASSAAAEPVQDYIARARSAANAESVIPVLWFVPKETAPADPTTLRLEALSILSEWVQTRQPPDERPVPPEPAADADTGDAETPAEEPATDAAPPAATPAEDTASTPAIAP